MNAVNTSPALTDPRRLLALAGIDLDNPDLQRELDAISARTAGRLGLPIGLVSLVLDTTQVFAGSHGVGGWLAAAGGTPVEWSFCAHTVTTGEPYIVDDAVNDSVQADNPLVTIDNVGSYAGVPLVVGGQVLGAHCVIGTTAHVFTDADLAELRIAAGDIIAVLQQYPLPDRC
jgi:GAF domain-containing protein